MLINRWLTSFMVLTITIVFSLILSTESVSAVTLSFETKGNVKRDGLLTGELVYNAQALQQAIRDISAERPELQQGATAPVPLSRIEGAQFKMSYISPYSGLEHTEATLCGKEVYDINGYEEVPLFGNREPLLVLSGVGVPEYVDFSSCIGRAGDVNLSISKRDSRISYSTADSLYGRLTVFDKDASGGVLFRKIKPIEFTLKP